MPHVFNAFFSYDLPFGKGTMFDVKNKALGAVVSGWQLSGISRFASGSPLGPITGTACSVSTMGTCYAGFNPSFTGPVRINGDWGDGNMLGPVANATAFIDKNAFVSPAAFTYGNTPVTGAFGLRNPHLLNTDMSVSRKFQIRENMRFVFGADGFNIFNYVRFGGINTNITNAAFGKVTSQANLPRVFQFKFRVEF
jgi:hypothetical protein